MNIKTIKTVLILASFALVAPTAQAEWQMETNFDAFDNTVVAIAGTDATKGWGTIAYMCKGNGKQALVLATEETMHDFGNIVPVKFKFIDTGEVLATQMMAQEEANVLIIKNDIQTIKPIKAAFERGSRIVARTERGSTIIFDSTGAKAILQQANSVCFK